MSCYSYVMWHVCCCVDCGISAHKHCKDRVIMECRSRTSAACHFNGTKNGSYTSKICFTSCTLWIKCMKFASKLQKNLCSKMIVARNYVDLIAFLIGFCLTVHAKSDLIIKVFEHCLELKGLLFSGVLLPWMHCLLVGNVKCYCLRSRRWVAINWPAKSVKATSCDIKLNVNSDRRSSGTVGWQCRRQQDDRWKQCEWCSDC